MPKCLHNGLCLDKFTCLNTCVCPTVPAICILAPLFVIREIIEINLHWALAPNVEATCKDTVHFFLYNHFIIYHFILTMELFSEIYRAELTSNTLFLHCMQKSHWSHWVIHSKWELLIRVEHRCADLRFCPSDRTMIKT